MKCIVECYHHKIGPCLRISIDAQCSESDFCIHEFFFVRFLVFELNRTRNRNGRWMPTISICSLVFACTKQLSGDHHSYSLIAICGGKKRKSVAQLWREIWTRLDAGWKKNTEKRHKKPRGWRHFKHHGGPIQGHSHWNPPYISPLYRIEEFKGGLLIVPHYAKPLGHACNIVPATPAISSATKMIQALISAQ